MKKVILYLLLTLILTGCSVGGRKDYTEKVQQYQSYYETILDQDKFEETSKFFDIKAEIGKSTDGYFYEVIIENAEIAMYDVKVLVVENKENFTDEAMQPSVGIFEAQPYNLVPGQVRKDKGYMNGFQLLKDISEPKVKLQVLVSFSDYRKLETFQEFIEFDLEYEQEKPKEEEKEKEENDKKEDKD